jgi:hypothetical protein
MIENTISFADYFSLSIGKNTKIIKNKLKIKIHKF